MKKTIVVTGATGTQGSSIVRVMLETGEWNVRAVTRNPDSEAAKSLVLNGVEVVYAEYDDEDSVRRAFKGAHAIFAVTNWWEYIRKGHSQAESGDIEERQGMTLARLAAETDTLEHYIWSTLPPAKELTGGKCPVPHFDYKAAVDRRIREELPNLASKTTFLFFGFYPTNFAFFPMLKPLIVPAARGSYVWFVPSKKNALVPISGDMERLPGLWVRQILAKPQIMFGKYAAVCCEVRRLEDLLVDWTRVTGKRAVFMEVSVEDFVQLWGPAGHEAALQLKFGEVVPDWYEHRKASFVTAEELDLSPEDVGTFKSALELVKQHLG